MSEIIRTQKEIYDQLMQRTATAYGVPVSEVGEAFHVLYTGFSHVFWQGDLLKSKVQQSIFSDLAERDELVREGLILLKRVPAPAVQGVYSVTVKNSAGVSIQAGTQFLSNTDSTSPGKIYVTDDDYSTTGDVLNDILPLTNPEGEITLRALTSGISSVLKIGDKLTSIQPLVNASDEVVVSAVITEARSEESIESYRADVIAAKARILNILTAATIRQMCLPVPEIRTVYPYLQKNNPGNIVVYVEATEENSVGIIGQPAQTVLDALYKYDGFNETGLLVYDEGSDEPRRHIGVVNYAVLPAVPRPVNIKLIGLTDNSKGEAIRNSVSDLLYSIRPFLAGADSSKSQNDTLDTPSVLSTIYSTLNGTGVVFTSMTISVDGVDVPSFRFIEGDYPYVSVVSNNGNPI